MNTNNNTGNYVPYKDYTSTSAICMDTSSSDPTSLTEFMKPPVFHEEIQVQVEFKNEPVALTY